MRLMNRLELRGPTEPENGRERLHSLVLSRGGNLSLTKPPAGIQPEGRKAPLKEVSVSPLTNEEIKEKLA